MALRHLLEFLEVEVVDIWQPVDLIRLASSCDASLQRPLQLVLDAEGCLDRLYGGFFPDWICGGQWLRMTHFLYSFVQAYRKGGIELVAMFKSGFEGHKHVEWIEEQRVLKIKINAVLRHLNSRGTLPPKGLWIGPTFLPQALRYALHCLDVPVISTLNDHMHEVINFSRGCGFQGLLADNPVYLAFAPNRFLYSRSLKLTLRGALETREMLVERIKTQLRLSTNKCCLFLAMLGNHILPESDMSEFYFDMGLRRDRSGSFPPKQVIAMVLRFLQRCDHVDDLMSFAEDVFRKCADKYRLQRVQRLIGAYEYYRLATIDAHWAGQTFSPAYCNQPTMDNEEPDSALSVTQPEPITVDKSVCSDEGVGETDQQMFDVSTAVDEPLTSQPPAADRRRGLLAAAWTSVQHPSHVQSPSPMSDSSVEPTGPTIPPINDRLLETARSRVGVGLMSPHIHHLLSLGELRLDCSLEETRCAGDQFAMPTTAELYRPLRQRIYGILFGQRAAEVVIREWTVAGVGSAASAQSDLVRALPAGAHVADIEQLWFGEQDDDKHKRMLAFLTCMDAHTPLMLNTAHVPRSCFLLCCTLRYLLSWQRCLLRRDELDCFLAQAVSSLLKNVASLQQLELLYISPRGVQLAQMLMRGIEMAAFANDVCGQPLAWPLVCPWMFFDGKLFQHKLSLAYASQGALLDICEHQMDEVMCVERMRAAILEGLTVDFNVQYTIWRQRPTCLEGHFVDSATMSAVERARINVPNTDAPAAHLPPGFSAECVEQPTRKLYLGRGTHFSSQVLESDPQVVSVIRPFPPGRARKYSHPSIGHGRQAHRPSESFDR